eukprot:7728648-Pyramimonas_sp.AAC.1
MVTDDDSADAEAEDGTARARVAAPVQKIGPRAAVGRGGGPPTCRPVSFAALFREALLACIAFVGLAPPDGSAV